MPARIGGSTLLAGCAAGIVGAGVLVVSCSPAAVSDESAFVKYAHTYMGGYYTSTAPQQGEQDRRWTFAHDDLVLAEGKRACAWLTNQPPAPDRAVGDRFVPSTVVGRYLTTAPAHVAPLSESGRAVVVTAAWRYLCRTVRASHTAPRRHQND